MVAAAAGDQGLTVAALRSVATVGMIDRMRSWRAVLLLVVAMTAPAVGAPTGSQPPPGAARAFDDAVAARRSADQIPADHPAHRDARRALLEAIERYLVAEAEAANGLAPRDRIVALQTARNTARALAADATLPSAFTAAVAGAAREHGATVQALAADDPYAAEAEAAWLAANAPDVPAAAQLRDELRDSIRARHEGQSRGAGALPVLHRIAALYWSGQAVHNLVRFDLETVLAHDMAIDVRGEGACAGLGRPLAATSRTGRPFPRVDVVVTITSCSTEQREYTQEETYSYEVNESREVSNGQALVCAPSCAWVDRKPGRINVRETVKAKRIVDHVTTTARLTARFELSARGHTVPGETITLEATFDDTRYAMRPELTPPDESSTKGFESTPADGHRRALALADTGTTTWRKRLDRAAQNLLGSTAWLAAADGQHPEHAAEAALRGDISVSAWLHRTTGMTPAALAATIRGTPRGEIGPLGTSHQLPTFESRVQFDGRYARGAQRVLLRGHEVSLDVIALEGDAGGTGLRAGFEWRYRELPTASLGLRVEAGLSEVSGDLGGLHLGFVVHASVRSSRASARRMPRIFTTEFLYAQESRAGETTFRNLGMSVEVRQPLGGVASVEAAATFNTLKLLDILSITDSDTVSHGLPFEAGASVYLGKHVVASARGDVVIWPTRDPRGWLTLTLRR